MPAAVPAVPLFTRGCRSGPPGGGRPSMLDAHQDAPLTKSPPEIGPARVLPYAGSTDHALDLLRRLDLLLRREVLRRRRSLPAVSGEPAPDWMRYAAVLDEEVDALLLRRTPAVADT